MMNLLLQSIRMTWRDARAGELRLLVLALVVAVSAVTSVAFFADRIRLAFERDAAQLLGGDVVVTADNPLPETFEARARALKLQTATTASFPSMAIHVGGTASDADAPASRLVSIKAVSAGYPLRGTVRIASAPNGPDVAATALPPAGRVWIDAQLVAGLGVGVGDALKLGDATLTIDRILTFEPDRGAAFANFAPRVLMRLDDLPRTGLIQPASRVTYRLLVAGAAEATRAFARDVKPQLARGQRLDALDGGRPEMQQTTERAGAFLSLVAMLAALLAALAIALATRRYSQRHLDACAVMRCLGATQGRVTALFMLEFALLGVVSSALGVLVGWGAHYGLVVWLGDLMQVSLPPPSAIPAVQGLVTGLVLLFAFALPPLLQLRAVAPLRVIRRDLGVRDASASVTYGVGMAGFFGLLWWIAGDAKIAAIAAGGFAAAFIAFAAIAWLALRASTPAQPAIARRSIALRFALAGVQRRPANTIVQVVSLAIGLMALLLLTVMRGDLVDAWRATVPPDAPNRFVINILPDQRDAFEQALEHNGIGRQPLAPMVRGRLVSVNGKPVSVDDYDGRAKRLVDREFNLSYMNDPPSYNRIVQGRWFTPNARELSIEQGIMKELGLHLGDTLGFDIAGQVVEAQLTSVRKVDWNSFKVNFFVVFPTAMLEPLQQSFITSFRMPAAFDAGPRLTAAFPNITVIDTGAIVRQVQAVLDQVIAAVEFLFGFTLIAGVLVLVTALASTADERLRETALLRALGATRAQLTRAYAFECVAIGGLAGLIAAAGALGVGWALAHFAFDVELRLDARVLILGAIAGACLALIGGWTGLRRVHRQPPSLTLREQA